MKRDMDLIRKMVLLIEERPHGRATSDIEVDGYTDEQIGYHAYLLVDSGLAVGCDVTTRGSFGPEYIISYLTSAGHDFADASRNETAWKKAKGIVREKAGSVTLEVMKQLLVSLLKQAIGLAG